MSQLQDSFLQDLRDRNQALIDAVSARFSGSGAALTRPPAAKSWSALECYEHLRVTLEGYLPGIEATIEKARVAGDAPEPYRPRWFARKFIGFVKPDRGNRIKAPGIFQPQLGDTTTATDKLRDVLAILERLDRAIVGADGVNLNRLRFPSPATSLLRFSVGEGLQLMVDHNERHHRQALRAADAADGLKSAAGSA